MEVQSTVPYALRFTVFDHQSPAIGEMDRVFPGELLMYPSSNELTPISMSDIFYKMQDIIAII